VKVCTGKGVVLFARWTCGEVEILDFFTSHRLWPLGAKVMHQEGMFLEGDFGTTILFLCNVSLGYIHYTVGIHCDNSK
jgi:hypothetical protein